MWFDGRKRNYSMSNSIVVLHEGFFFTWALDTQLAVMAWLYSTLRICTDNSVIISCTWIHVLNAYLEIQTIKKVYNVYYVVARSNWEATQYERGGSHGVKQDTSWVSSTYWVGNWKIEKKIDSFHVAFWCHKAWHNYLVKWLLFWLTSCIKIKWTLPTKSSASKEKMTTLRTTFIA